MFTGLIEGTGHVEEIRADARTGGVLRVGELPWDEPNAVGESIAVNGACLTVASTGHGFFEVETSPETLSRSNLSYLTIEDVVNLERPLRVGDRLGGHLVLGHVDGLGSLVRIESAGSFWTIEVELPAELSRYAVEKGSIAVDGISLTIASLTGISFTVAVIPKTWEMTNLSKRRIGDRLNLETDIIAKHIEQLMKPYAPDSRITAQFLSEHGFI